MKVKAKKAGAAVLAAITSPEAVKLEKSVAVLVIVRVLQAVGASYALEQLVQKLAH